MLKAEIISNLYLSKEVNEAIQKMEPDHLRDDLKAEMFSALCELPDDRIIKMHEAGFLLYYTLRMMLRMVKSNRSTFYRRYRDQFAEFNESISIPDEDTNDYPEDYYDALKDVNEWDMRILEAYIEHGSKERVSEMIGISRRQVHYMINNARKRITTSMEDNRSLEITLSIPVRINVIKEIQDVEKLVERYGEHIKSSLRGIHVDDNSVIYRPEFSNPVILKIYHVNTHSFRDGPKSGPDKGGAVAGEISFPEP